MGAEFDCRRKGKHNYIVHLFDNNTNSSSLSTGNNNSSQNLTQNIESNHISHEESSSAKQNSEKIMVIREELSESLIREGEILGEEEENKTDENGLEMNSDVVACSDFIFDEDEDEENNLGMLAKDNKDKDKDEMEINSINENEKTSSVISKTDKSLEVFYLFFSCIFLFILYCLNIFNYINFIYIVFWKAIKAITFQNHQLAIQVKRTTYWLMDIDWYHLLRKISKNR